MLKLIATLVAVAFVISSCKTMEGTHKDVDTGKGLQNSAEKHKPNTEPSVPRGPWI